MKRIISLLIVIMVCSLSLSAAAESNKIGREYTIEEECKFTVKSAKSYDVFFNQDSGTSKTWIVISFEVLNLRTDSFFVKTETDAQLIFEDDYEFSPDYLWVNPEGSYFRSDGSEWLNVYFMDDSGKLYSDGDDANGGYAAPGIKYHNGVERKYNPIGIYFDYNNDGPNDTATYKSQDSSKTILDPLVKRTYHYVFLVPDLVADEEGARELLFTVVGEEYSYQF